MYKSGYIGLLLPWVLCGPQLTIQSKDPSPCTVLYDSIGIRCRNGCFNAKEVPVNHTWTGDWIWLDPKTYPRFQSTHTQWINNKENLVNYRVLFRKVFTLDQSPNEALLYSSGDVSYRLYVNGNLIQNGPDNIGSDYLDTLPPRHWFYTVRNIRDYLVPGENTLAAELYAFHLALSETTTGRGGFMCDLELDDPRRILATDSNWHATLDTALGKIPGALLVDSRKESCDWRSPGYDDNGWENAAELRNIPSGWQNLIPSRIPALIRFPVKPVEIRLSGEGSGREISRACPLPLLPDEEYISDFGINLTGYIRFRISGKAGDTLTVSSRESLGSPPNRILYYILRQGDQVFETPYFSAHRYLEITTKSGNQIMLKDLSTVYTGYPVQYRGSFECSDPFLNDLWQVARWATQLCMNSYHMDSPVHQEPIACTGDYLIQALNNYCAFGDPWLVRQDLIKTALMLRKKNYAMFHTSYSLLWVQMLHDYYRYTGDSALVKELLPDVNALLDRFRSYTGKEGLLSGCPDYMFMDWTGICGFNAHHPPAVIGIGYMTAFYYRALVLASKLNLACGERTKSDELKNQSREVKNSFNRVLWDDSVSLYRDGLPGITRSVPGTWLPPDTNIISHSSHVNALAVLYGLVPPEKRDVLISFIVKQEDITVQPYFMHFILAALTETENFGKYGIQLLHRWKNSIDPASRTITENWSSVTEYGYRGDYSHAWGGSGLYHLTVNILGIRPGTPGMRKIVYKPVTAGLSFSRGQFPLADGSEIRISWKNGKDGFESELSIPAGYTVEFHPPGTYLGHPVLLNGKHVDPDDGTIQLREGRQILRIL